MILFVIFCNNTFISFCSSKFEEVTEVLDDGLPEPIPGSSHSLFSDSLAEQDTILEIWPKSGHRPPDLYWHIVDSGCQNLPENNTVPVKANWMATSHWRTSDIINWNELYTEVLTYCIKREIGKKTLPLYYYLN